MSVLSREETQKYKRTVTLARHYCELTGQELTVFELLCSICPSGSFHTMFIAKYFED